ncbi:hypothetical protein FDECE_8791 [Fusarium decemcellulare]|nr:hypothetical protein FDECE_8791 [Fusarium decemcellulare]
MQLDYLQQAVWKPKQEINQLVEKVRDLEQQSRGFLKAVESLAAVLFGTAPLGGRPAQTAASRPFWHNTALLVKVELTGMIFARFHTEATQVALLGSLESFESMIQRQYVLGLRIFYQDNDPALRTAYLD